MLDQLMVDSWQRSAMYDDYYNQCRPTECSYTLMGRNDAVYIVTTIIGLVGGLATALKLLIPSLVTLIMFRIYRRPDPSGTTGSPLLNVYRRILSCSPTTSHEFPCPPASNHGLVQRSEPLRHCSTLSRSRTASSTVHFHPALSYFVYFLANHPRHLHIHSAIQSNNHGKKRQPRRIHGTL